MTAWFPIALSLAGAVITPFSALAALLLLPLALPVLWRGQLDMRGGLPWLLFGWLVWLPASLLWSQSPGLSLPQAAVLLCLPLGWLAGLTLHRRGQLARLLDYGLPSLLLVLMLWGLLQGPNTFTGKPQGPFNDPNTYAAVLNLLVLPLLARYLAADLSRLAPWWRTAQLALLAGVGLVAFLAASRGASLALLLVLPALLWLARKQPDFARKLALLAAVTLVAYVSAQTISGSTGVGQRLADTVQGGDPSRIMLLQSAWLMIQGHPWLGTGLGSFRLFYPPYRYAAESGTAGGWVHNDYLQLWQEAGLPMLLLLLGLVLWVAWTAWRTLRDGGGDALPRMGYLTAIAAILLHALVNFLFFFALVSLLVGLYLARVASPGPSPEGRGEHTRAIRLATGGYALILAWLLTGQVAVEVLVGQARPIQQVLLKWEIAYPRYQVAYWLSVLAPFHPTPQQVMGLELVSISGGGGLIRDAALQRMEAGWQRAPCYLPYANDALNLIGAKPDAALRQRGQAIAARSLDCNARHGLSYYYAGRLALTDVEALVWWQAGIAASPFPLDDLLLATAILSRSTPGRAKELAALAEQMAQAIRTLEANPMRRADPVFWTDAQYQLFHLAGKRYPAPVPPG